MTNVLATTDIVPSNDGTDAKASNPGNADEGSPAESTTNATTTETDPVADADEISSNAVSIFKVLQYSFRFKNQKLFPIYNHQKFKIFKEDKIIEYANKNIMDVSTVTTNVISGKTEQEFTQAFQTVLDMEASVVAPVAKAEIKASVAASRDGRSGETKKYSQSRIQVTKKFLRLQSAFDNCKSFQKSLETYLTEEVYNAMLEIENREAASAFLKRYGTFYIEQVHIGGLRTHATEDADSFSIDKSNESRDLVAYSKGCLSYFLPWLPLLGASTVKQIASESGNSSKQNAKVNGTVLGGKPCHFSSDRETWIASITEGNYGICECKFKPIYELIPKEFEKEKKKDLNEKENVPQEAEKKKMKEKKKDLNEKENVPQEAEKKKLKDLLKDLNEKENVPQEAEKKKLNEKIAELFAQVRKYLKEQHNLLLQEQMRSEEEEDEIEHLSKLFLIQNEAYETHFLKASDCTPHDTTMDKEKGQTKVDYAVAILDNFCEVEQDDHEIEPTIDRLVCLTDTTAFFGRKTDIFYFLGDSIHISDAGDRMDVNYQWRLMHVRDRNGTYYITTPDKRMMLGLVREPTKEKQYRYTLQRFKKYSTKSNMNFMWHFIPISNEMTKQKAVGEFA